MTRVKVYGGALPRRRAVLRFAVRAVKYLREMHGGEISIVLTGDRGIQSLNKKFLRRDRTTDVIAFPLENASAAPSPGAPTGEIYINLQAAARQARSLGHSAMDETEILTLHGLLHLCGHRDHPASARRRMDARAEKVFLGMSRG